MLELTYPWMLLLLPLPLLVHFLIPAYRTKQSAVKVPFFEILVEILGETPSSGASQLKANWWQRLILIASWCLLVFAMCKPMMLGESQTRELMGRDIMVVVDLSGSMAEPDFTSTDGDKVSRIEAVKEVLAEFVEA
ncbi:bacteroides aerotolerance operon [Vibrio ishigakensis]|uniref:Bacteroides aerotolerance operon n=1 Tax=Vibrio ishigakensis TaxID=1481914 RepID=A0A0B8PNG8_9VIBR|nr:bacteroides aerotolerance operon [Vibrio ishigakensis]